MNTKHMTEIDRTELSELIARVASFINLSLQDSCE